MLYKMEQFEMCYVDKLLWLIKKRGINRKNSVHRIRFLHHLRISSQALSLLQHSTLSPGSSGSHSTPQAAIDSEPLQAMSYLQFPHTMATVP